MNDMMLIFLSVWFAVFSFIWDKSDIKNVMFKTLFFGLSVWSNYLLYNSQFNNVTFIVLVVSTSVFLTFIWKSAGVLNLIVKIAFGFIAVYGVTVIFQRHLI